MIHNIFAYVDEKYMCSFIVTSNVSTFAEIFPLEFNFILIFHSK